MQKGIKMVLGCREDLKPITGAPEGKSRIRMRAGRVAALFVKTKSGLRQFLLEDRGEYWFANPKLYVAGNERYPRRGPHAPGADISKFKSFQFV